MAKAPLLRHLDLNKVFEVAYDASGVGIGSIIGQDNHLIAIFSEKLNKCRRVKYNNYEEFYTLASGALAIQTPT